MFYYDLSFLLASSLIPISLCYSFFYFRSQSFLKKDDSLIEDRLFFHDLVNQTHSILLYLEHKFEKHQKIEGHEIQDLSREVSLIQKLIHSHFKIEHRHLEVNSGDWVPFDAIKAKVERETEVFLSNKGISAHLYFTGMIGPSADPKKSQLALVKEESFFRIFTNLIKNISEHSPSSVDIYINYGPEGLDLVTKNDAFRLHHEMEDLSGTLSSIITEDTTQEKALRGLGLESVERMVVKLGGNFEFRFEEKYWINRLYLPSPTVFERIKKGKLFKAA